MLHCLYGSYQLAGGCQAHARRLVGAPVILAADIGGITIAAALIDDLGELASEILQTPTPASEGVAGILEATVGPRHQLDGRVVELIAIRPAGVINVCTGSVVAANRGEPVLGGRAPA